MTDTSLLTGTATFSRKVSPKQYESAESGLYVQFTIDPNWADEQIEKEAARAQNLVRSLVLTDLGIPFDMDGNGNIIEVGGVTGVAAVTQAFPGSQVQPTQPQQQNASVPGTPPAPTGNKSADRDAIRAWGQARFASNPDEFYDNRSRKASGEYKATSPDLKHKATGTGIWLS